MKRGTRLAPKLPSAKRARRVTATTPNPLPISSSSSGPSPPPSLSSLFPPSPPPPPACQPHSDHPCLSASSCSPATSRPSPDEHSSPTPLFSSSSSSTCPSVAPTPQHDVEGEEEGSSGRVKVWEGHQKEEVKEVCQVDASTESPLVTDSFPSSFSSSFPSSSSSSSSYVSRRRGGKGLGVTVLSGVGGQAVASMNRTVAARRTINSRLATFASQLHLSSSLIPLALDFIERVVEGRYGEGRSRWMELLCMAALYIVHRQQRTRASPSPPPSSPAPPPSSTVVIGQMAELVHVPCSVLLQIIQRAQDMGAVKLRGLEGGEYVEAALTAVKWKEEGGGQGAKIEALERHALVRERCQQVKNKLHHLLAVVKLYGLHGGRTPSVLCGGAAALVLSCHPYLTFHCHARPAELLRVLSAALRHSPRSLSDCRTAVRVELSRMLPVVDGLTPSSLSLSLMLSQLDVLDRPSEWSSAPVDSTTPSSSNVALSVVWGEGEEQEGEGESEEGSWGGLSGELNVDDYIRTEPEVEEWQRICSTVNREGAGQGKETTEPRPSKRMKCSVTRESPQSSDADGVT